MAVRARIVERFQPCLYYLGGSLQAFAGNDALVGHKRRRGCSEVDSAE
jgi:hypothetical protein